MEGAILAIGNELVQGKVRNTTSFWAAQRLFLSGYKIKEIITIPDDLQLIKERLSYLVKRYPFVIISGGLGPTTDDVTNQALAETLNLPLETNQEVLTHIRAREKDLGLRPNPLRERMAVLPKGAQPLTHTKAMAGYLIRYAKCLLFCLPGVPKEFLYLLEEKVIPLLRKHLPPSQAISSLTLKIFGLREADINLELQDLEEENLSIGYYPQLPEIHLTMTALGKSEEEAHQRLQKALRKIKALFGEYIFGQNRDTLESVVGKLLSERGETLAVAESCTGGLIASRITRIPGSSSYFDRGVVTYSNQAKIDLLGVSKRCLETHGAVSKATALAMAEGIRRISKTTYGLSVTGIAGPTGGSPHKPVGTVWIGFSCPQGTVAQCFLFPGDRQLVQDFAATTALDWLRRYLTYDTLLPSYKFLRTC